jgi:hypothetical protein
MTVNVRYCQTLFTFVFCFSFVLLFNFLSRFYRDLIEKCRQQRGEPAQFLNIHSLLFLSSNTLTRTTKNLQFPNRFARFCLIHTEIWVHTTQSSSVFSSLSCGFYLKPREIQFKSIVLIFNWEIRSIPLIYYLEAALLAPNTLTKQKRYKNHLFEQRRKS